MPSEASKTRQIWTDDVLSLMQGEGIDIGCGDDPVLPGVARFDREQGDANRITQYVHRQYDFVFASHVLEHMHDPYSALAEWYRILKPGGHLIVLVPDEDLYEQGIFPSIFNGDHKRTFTISKARSWSPASINVLHLARSVGGEVISVELQDHGYDRALLQHAPSRNRLRLLTVWRALARRPGLRRWRRLLEATFIGIGSTVDQTAMPGRLAQIQFIVRKTP